MLTKVIFILIKNTQTLNTNLSLIWRILTRFRCLFKAVKVFFSALTRQEFNTETSQFSKISFST